MSYKNVVGEIALRVTGLVTSTGSGDSVAHAASTEQVQYLGEITDIDFPSLTPNVQDLQGTSGALLKRTLPGVDVGDLTVTVQRYSKLLRANAGIDDIKVGDTTYTPEIRIAVDVEDPEATGGYKKVFIYASGPYTHDPQPFNPYGRGAAPFTTVVTMQCSKYGEWDITGVTGDPFAVEPGTTPLVKDDATCLVYQSAEDGEDIHSGVNRVSGFKARWNIT